MTAAHFSHTLSLSPSLPLSFSSYLSPSSLPLSLSLSPPLSLPLSLSLFPFTLSLSFLLSHPPPSPFGACDILMFSHTQDTSYTFMCTHSSTCVSRSLFLAAHDLLSLSALFLPHSLQRTYRHGVSMPACFFTLGKRQPWPQLWGFPTAASRHPFPT